MALAPGHANSQEPFAGDEQAVMRVRPRPGELERKIPSKLGQGHFRRYFGELEARVGGSSEVSTPIVGVATVPLGFRDVNEDFSQFRQSVAALSNGNFAAVWTHGSYPDVDVRMQYVSPEGARLLGRRGRAVARKKSLFEGSPVLVAAPDGGVFVAFRSGDVIRVQRFDASGKRMWPGRGVRLARGSRFAVHSSPHLVSDESGGVFGCADGTVGIFCQRLGPNGDRLWGATGRPAGGRLGYTALPKGVSDGAGGLIVFWRNLGTADRDQLIEGQRFSSRGTRLWGTKGIIARTTNLGKAGGYGMNGFGVVPDGFGGAVVSFNDWLNQDRFAFDVAAQRVAPDGALLWPDPTPVVARQHRSEHATPIATGDGGAFVITLEGPGPRLRVYRLGPRGEHVWTSKGTKVSAPGDANYFGFGSFDRGFLRIGWNRGQSGTFDYDIKMARYDASGKRFTPREGHPISGAPGAQFLHGLAFSKQTGSTFLAFDDWENGTSNRDVTGAVVVESE